MLRRLLLGLAEGLLIGTVLGVVCRYGLGLGAPSTLMAVALGALSGAVTGLVAGRPIWAKNAKVEALLKSVVGALLGGGLSLALRHWLNLTVDLHAFSLGIGPAGRLSSTFLPVISTVLALLFELDDHGDRAQASASNAGIGAAPRRVRAPDDERVNRDPSEEPTEENAPRREKH